MTAIKSPIKKKFIKSMFLKSVYKSSGKHGECKSYLWLKCNSRMKLHFSASEMLYFIVPMSTDGTTLAVLTTATTFVHKNKGKPVSR